MKIFIKLKATPNIPECPVSDFFCWGESETMALLCRHVIIQIKSSTLHKAPNRNLVGSGEGRYMQLYPANEETVYRIWTHGLQIIRQQPSSCAKAHPLNMSSFKYQIKKKQKQKADAPQQLWLMFIDICSWTWPSPFPRSKLLE